MINELLGLNGLNCCYNFQVRTTIDATFNAAMNIVFDDAHRETTLVLKHLLNWDMVLCCLHSF